MVSADMYELWDTDTGNRVGVFDNEAAALVEVFTTATEYGAESAEVLSLGLLGPDGAVAHGRELLEQARRQANARSRAA